MNYKKYDEKFTFNYREDLLKKANDFGFTYITEAIHKLYKKHKSSIIVGEIFGVTDPTIRRWLRMMKVPIRSKGGQRNKPVTKFLKDLEIGQEQHITKRWINKNRKNLFSLISSIKYYASKNNKKFGYKSTKTGIYVKRIK